MSNKTVYEDKAEKEARRKQKQQEQIKKHTAACPHCGKDVLDSMPKCPHCGGKLEFGYTPMSDEKRKKIRIVTYAVGFAIAIAVFVIVMVLK